MERGGCVERGKGSVWREVRGVCGERQVCGERWVCGER